MKAQWLLRVKRKSSKKKRSKKGLVLLIHQNLLWKISKRSLKILKINQSIIKEDKVMNIIYLKGKLMRPKWDLPLTHIHVKTLKVNRQEERLLSRSSKDHNLSMKTRKNPSKWRSLSRSTAFLLLPKRSLIRKSLWQINVRSNIKEYLRKARVIRIIATS